MDIKQTKKIDVTGDLLSVARLPNTEQLWMGSSDFKLYVIDLAQEKPKPEPLEGHASYVSGVVLAESAIVSAGWDRKLIWWDRDSRQPTRTVDAHKRWIRQLAVSADGKRLATVSWFVNCVDMPRSCHVTTIVTSCLHAHFRQTVTSLRRRTNCVTSSFGKRKPARKRLASARAVSFRTTGIEITIPGADCGAWPSRPTESGWPWAA